ncbi:hypothetical protein ACQP3C_30840, partial [Escherichia coli]
SVLLRKKRKGCKEGSGMCWGCLGEWGGGIESPKRKWEWGMLEADNHDALSTYMNLSKNQ